MPVSKDTLFIYRLDNESEGDFFRDVFPDMPDKSGLTKNMDAVTCMSDEAFIYYLPFLLECLEEDVAAYDRLITIVEVNLRHMDPETEEKYKTELASARSRVAAINAVL